VPSLANSRYSGRVRHIVVVICTHCQSYRCRVVFASQIKPANLQCTSAQTVADAQCGARVPARASISTPLPVTEWFPQAQRSPNGAMSPSLTQDEVDDLLYLARIGDNDELSTLVAQLAEREKCPAFEILAAARDEGKSTCLHMACGNGHLG
jgi:hypothetical protein